MHSRSFMTLTCVKLDSSTRKMEKRTEKFGTQLSYFDKPGARRESLKRDTTYLAKIALVLQDAPGKMLTFAQLMDKLAPLNSEDGRCVKNIIRVCLSVYKCFVKVLRRFAFPHQIRFPQRLLAAHAAKKARACCRLGTVALCSRHRGTTTPANPDSRDSKKNYWKLDCSQITAKMVRRHFKRNLKIFPELASKLKADCLTRPSERISAIPSPEPAACSTVKFTGPFSIESLLKRNSPSFQVSRGSPLSSVQIWADQQQQQPWPKHTMRTSSCYSEKDLFLHTSSGCSLICSAGGSAHRGTVEPNRWITEPSSSIYTSARAPSYFTSSASYFMYSAPMFTPKNPRF